MSSSVLVAPGTGKQGQAVCRELVRRGHSVRALARNPSSPAAQALAELGVSIYAASLDEKEAVRSSLQGIDAVFLSVPAHPVNEVRFATNVIEAAEEAGVQQLVYASVARAGEHESFPGWKGDDPSAHPMSWYWLNKAAIEARVRGTSIPAFTILRPAFFMSNFAAPDCEFMFPGLSEKHQLRLAYRPDTRLHLIDVADIAKFAASSFENPAGWAGKAVPLAAEALTGEELAQRLSDATGKAVRAVFISDDEAAQLKAQGHRAMDAQIWQREVGYGVDVDEARGHGIPLTTMADMLRRDGAGW